MDLNKLISKFWTDIFPESVIHLSTYRFERSKRYPGVGYKWFEDPFNAKRWRQEELKRLQRKDHNDGVLARYRESLKPKNPNGV